MYYKMYQLDLTFKKTIRHLPGTARPPLTGVIHQELHSITINTSVAGPVEDNIIMGGLPHNLCMHNCVHL